MVRDDTPVAPEIFNGTHNMPGENGMKWDPAMKRERDERDAREREDGTPHSEYRDTRDGWRRTHDEVNTRTTERNDGASATTRFMHESMGMDDIDREFRLEGYSSLGEGVMGWLSGLTNSNEHGVPVVQRPVLIELGIPEDGLVDVHKDGALVRRVYRTMMQEGDEKRATPKSESAIKARWTQLTSTTAEGEVYLWYKRTQKQAIAYGIPLMPFRGIALRHGKYGLCLPGLGLATYESCGELFGDVLRTCMPDDDSEGADSIRELLAHHENGFAFLWDVLENVVGMMDEHMVPERPEYKGSLAKHAGAWDVHQMMMTQRGTKFTKADCSIAFLKDVRCPRFAPAAKVELGLLRNEIPQNAACGAAWAMPDKYDVRVLAQRILQNSPPPATTEEDMGKIGRPTIRRLEF